MAVGQLGSIIPALAGLEGLVQENALERMFRDPLYQSLQFRDEAKREKWLANIGEVSIQTRRSLLDISTKPLTPGADPTPKSVRFEQFEVQAAQYADSTDTFMPANRTALAATFLEDAEALGLQSGGTLNRVARNTLYANYLSGHAITSALGAAVTAVSVNSLAGFTDTFVGTRRVPVSNLNPLPVVIAGATPSPNVNVVGAAPADADFPFGPGVLTIDVASTFAANVAVDAADAPIVLRVGNVASVDGLTATSALTLAPIQKAISILRTNRVPVHADGHYHVQIDPLGEHQIFQDNQFQRLNQGVPDGLRYADYTIGKLLRSLFMTNDESPNDETMSIHETSGDGLVATGRGDEIIGRDICAPVRNANGVRILRAIVTGGGALLEKYIDEDEYISEAGIQGKIGNFAVTNGGMSINLDGIRYILRAPQDRLQQVVSQSWSWSGGWTVPTDILGGKSGAQFKRAIVVEFGVEG